MMIYSTAKNLMGVAQIVFLITILTRSFCRVQSNLIKFHPEANKKLKLGLVQYYTFDLFFYLMFLIINSTLVIMNLTGFKKSSPKYFLMIDMIEGYLSNWFPVI